MKTNMVYKVNDLVIFMDQGDTISGSDFFKAQVILGRIKDYDYRVVEDKTGKIAPGMNHAKEIAPFGLYKLIGYILELMGT